MAFHDLLTINPILTDTSVPISDKTAYSLGAISAKAYQGLSQSDKDRYVMIFFRYSSNPDVKDIAYVPIIAMPRVYFTSIAMEPWSERKFSVDGKVAIYSGGEYRGYIYEDGGYLEKVYKQRIIDGANRAVNYINFFKKRGELVNIDELVSIVMNDYGSVLSYKGPYIMVLVDGTTMDASIDPSYIDLIHDYAREATEIGAQMVVDSVREEISKSQEQQASTQGPVMSDQKPITAGVGTVPMIGIIALLGLSLRTMMQKRRK